MTNPFFLVASERHGKQRRETRRYGLLTAIVALSGFALTGNSACVLAAEPESGSYAYAEFSAFDATTPPPFALPDSQGLNAGQLVLAPQLSFSGWSTLVMQPHSEGWQLALKLSMVDADATPQRADDLSLRESSSLHLHFQYRF